MKFYLILVLFVTITKAQLEYKNKLENKELDQTTILLEPGIIVNINFTKVIGLHFQPRLPFIKTIFDDFLKKSEFSFLNSYTISHKRNNNKSSTKRRVLWVNKETKSVLEFYVNSSEKSYKSGQRRHKSESLNYQFLFNNKGDELSIDLEPLLKTLKKEIKYFESNNNIFKVQINISSGYN